MVLDYYNFQMMPVNKHVSDIKRQGLQTGQIVVLVLVFKGKYLQVNWFHIYAGATDRTNCGISPCVQRKVFTCQLVSYLCKLYT